MPNGQYPGGHAANHGLKHGDDHGHLPEDEVLKLAGSRAFKLDAYQKKNLKEIEARLRSGEELGHKELHDYQHYLEHLTHELKEILQEEHGDHIHNLQLEKDLRKVATLLGEVSSVLDRH